VRVRSMVSWKGAYGKRIEESARVEDVLSWGEGVCEKSLRLVIGEYTVNISYPLLLERNSLPLLIPFRIIED
jgi:hypothetical protein